MAALVLPNAAILQGAFVSRRRITLRRLDCHRIFVSSKRTAVTNGRRLSSRAGSSSIEVERSGFPGSKELSYKNDTSSRVDFSNAFSNVSNFCQRLCLVKVALAVALAQRVISYFVWSRVTEEERQLLIAMKGRMACAAAPIFFAAVSQSSLVNTPLTVVASGMAKWLELYSGVLMIRVLLSWFPNIPWERQPLQAIRDMCDPYLNLFRNIVPPLFNALDVSPMLAFLVLGCLTSILNTTV